MKSKTPFLEDEEGNLITRTEFRRMRKAEKREAMRQWFGSNFEDPVHHTSYMSSEGGYLWNHGGPYDAKDELFDKFGSIVPEAFIDELVTELQDENGVYEWAGTPQHEQDYEDYDDDERSPPPTPFDSFGDQPTERLGSDEDRAARESVWAAAEGLLRALDKKPAGIGHNNPPEEIGEYAEAEEIRSNATELKSEIAKPSPSIAVVKRIGSALYRAAGASMKWVGGKLDRLVDKTIDSLAPLAAVGIAAYHDQVAGVLVSIFEWLKIVAHTIF